MKKNKLMTIIVCTALFMEIAIVSVAAPDPADPSPIPCEKLKKNYPNIIGDEFQSVWQPIGSPIDISEYYAISNDVEAACESEMQTQNSANRQDCVTFCTQNNQQCDANYQNGPLDCTVDAGLNQLPNHWVYYFHAHGEATSKCQCKTPHPPPA